MPPSKIIIVVCKLCLTIFAIFFSLLVLLWILRLFLIDVCGRSQASPYGCFSKRHLTFFGPIFMFSMIISTPKFLEMTVSLENITWSKNETLTYENYQLEYMPVPSDIYSNTKFQFWYHIMLLLFLITIPMCLLSYLNYKIFLKLNGDGKVSECKEIGNSQTGS
jgi:hypothetical protein